MKGALLLGAGGLGALVAALVAFRKSETTKGAVMDAVKNGGTFQARLTGYWPFAARPDEKKMEGGVNDRRGKPLHTLEQHLADAKAHPYVAVSGDDAVFPYGQGLRIDAWPTAVFRVVDTGSHFRGANKVYRVAGYEPLDVCVNSSSTQVPKLATVRIVAGDHFDKAGKQVATSGLRGQTVTGLDLLGAKA